MQHRKTHMCNFPGFTKNRVTNSSWFAQDFLGFIAQSPASQEIPQSQDTTYPGAASGSPSPHWLSKLIVVQCSLNCHWKHPGYSRSKSSQPQRRVQLNHSYHRHSQVSGKVPVFLETPKINGMHDYHYWNCWLGHPSPTTSLRRSPACTTL